ncbi:hypothetical protein [Fodinibius salsisoli]|uniref:Uncharacterized protein n=1 Tax=Fodinibius salsisoli TaxID=2820877 RepID=A0ABT3PH08_9BACT|nr:hypothetical protein [Fodinibius salsisoli]MCW9705213.1 hypothetical protein [Fodinibius salsisoli]
MKRIIVIITAFTAIANITTAQHLQQELLSGTEKMVFQTTFSQQWNQNPNLRVNGLAFFNRFYDSADRTFDEAVVLTSVTGSLSKHFSAGPKLFYSSVAGLQPGLLLNAHTRVAGIDMRLTPQAAYNVANQAFQGGLALLLRKMVPISSQWSIAADAFLMGSWLRFDTHDRSNIQARIGPVYKKHFQFGFSYDLDQYGPKILHRDQFGAFTRILFN